MLERSLDEYKSSAVLFRLMVGTSTLVTPTYRQRHHSTLMIQLSGNWSVHRPVFQGRKDKTRLGVDPVWRRMGLHSFRMYEYTTYCSKIAEGRCEDGNPQPMPTAEWPRFPTKTNFHCSYVSAEFLKVSKLHATSTAATQSANKHSHPKNTSQIRKSKTTNSFPIIAIVL